MSVKIFIAAHVSKRIFNESLTDDTDIENFTSIQATSSSSIKDV